MIKNIFHKIYKLKILGKLEGKTKLSKTLIEVIQVYFM